MRYRPELDDLARVYECCMNQGSQTAIITVEPQETEHVEDVSEIEHAKSELKKAAEYATKLFTMVDSVGNLEGWTAAKIIQASDYLSSVYHWLDYELSKTQDGVCSDQTTTIQTGFENL